ncbi:hypothetical protein LOK49_LG04G01594 [Camellia lanceoleosa]|uniref:Uncharacterized protein n=1 Tax=Camellia lanceoleosa TaxID=1840588 RepID=A0ACC0I2Z2_9ERIC|nr:hypothetical protein LOK49_LG04G01594 [Camellia lanceoleosa]
MGAPQNLSSSRCELRIIRAKNIELKSNGHLFVRCYLSAGNNNRVRLDSQEISSKSDLFWNETLSLECSGTQDSMEMLLMQGSVVFELRWRSSLPVLGKIGGSHLLGRAEIPWKTVSETPEMKTEKWAVMVPKSRRVYEDIKPPAVQVAMKLKVPTVKEATSVPVPVLMPTTLRKRRNNQRVTNSDECGCVDVGCNCADYDMFALVAALDGF